MELELLSNDGGGDNGIFFKIWVQRTLYPRGKKGASLTGSKVLMAHVKVQLMRAGKAGVIGGERRNWMRSFEEDHYEAK